MYRQAFGNKPVGLSVFHCTLIAHFSCYYARGVGIFLYNIKVEAPQLGLAYTSASCRPARLRRFVDVLSAFLLPARRFVSSQIVNMLTDLATSPFDRPRLGGTNDPQINIRCLPAELGNVVLIV